MRRLISVILLTTALGFGFTLPERPVNSFILDEANVINAADEVAINSVAQEIWNKTKVGMAVATFTDIEDEDYRDLAQRIAQKWGVGKKGQDEGVLFFLALNQKKRSMETGYGSEPYLPDAICERIMQEYMVPSFRQNDFSGGLRNSFLATAQLIAQEKGIALEGLPQQAPVARQRSGQGTGFGFIIFIVIIVLLFGRGGGSGLLLGMLLGNALGGSRHSSGFGGGFSGSSSGGFGGGFSGGSFGGGGSGGSW